MSFTSVFSARIPSFYTNARHSAPSFEGIRFKGNSGTPASDAPQGDAFLRTLPPKFLEKAAIENLEELNHGPLYEHDVQLLKNASVYHQKRGEMDQAIACLLQGLLIQQQEFRRQFGDDNADKLEQILTQPAVSPQEFAVRVRSAIKEQAARTAPKEKPQTTHKAVTLSAARQTERLLKEIADLHIMQGDTEKALQAMQARPFVIALSGHWMDGDAFPDLNHLSDTYLRLEQKEEAMLIIGLTLSLLDQRKMYHDSTPMGSNRTDLMDIYLDHMLQRSTPVPSYAVKLLKDILKKQRIPDMAAESRQELETALLKLAEKAEQFAKLPNEHPQEPETFRALAMECRQEAAEVRTQEKWKNIDRITETGSYL